MSHELRTPISVIRGFARLLDLAEDRPADDTEGLSRILKAGRHLLTLRDEVLDIAGIEGSGLSSKTFWRRPPRHPGRMLRVANLCVPYIPGGFTFESLIPPVDRRVYPTGE